MLYSRSFRSKIGAADVNTKRRVNIISLAKHIADFFTKACSHKNGIINHSEGKLY